MGQVGHIAARLIALSAAVLAFQSSAQVGGNFEPPPTIRPDRILSASMLSSGNHRVLDDVLTKGNWLEFEVESDFGNYRPPSLAMLSIRLQEIRTLAQAVDQFKRSNKRLAERLRGQLTVGADSFVQILSSPIRTTTKIVDQFTTNVGQTFEEFGEFQPRPTQRDVKQTNIYEQFEPGDPVLASHKRNVASQLDLDVYSSNPRVQDFLDTLAAARSSGQQTAGVVTVSLPGDDRIRVAGGRVEAAIRTALTHNTINQLYRRNADALVGAGVRAEAADEFLTQRNLSPRHKTAITEHIAFLRGVANSQALLRASLNASTENEALAYVQVARLLSSYQERAGALEQLVPAGHVVLATTKAGGILAFMPYDIIYWNEATQRTFFGLARYAQDRGFNQREIVSAGIYTDTAREQLEALGFTLRQRFLHTR